MKTQLTLTLLAMALVTSAGRAAVDPEKVPWPLDRAFVPVGFDSNDKVQVMVQGQFPSTCYKVGNYRTETDYNNQVIKVYQEAYEYGGVCLRIVVPFAQVIDLGVVRTGDFKLVDGINGKELGGLGVTTATNEGPDDFLYAPVSDAFVQFDDAVGFNRLTVKGNFADRCTKLKEVKLYEKNRVIVVQPIAEHEGTSGVGSCSAEPTRYSKTVMLPREWQGDYMLHVRSMNGQAINKIVELNLD